jgi:hypothetical protein
MATTVYTAIIEKEGALYAACAPSWTWPVKARRWKRRPPISERLSSYSWSVPIRKRSSVGFGPRFL